MCDGLSIKVSIYNIFTHTKYDEYKNTVVQSLEFALDAVKTSIESLALSYRINTRMVVVYNNYCILKESAI